MPARATLDALRRQEVRFSHLSAWSAPAEFRTPNLPRGCPADRSDHVRCALERLHTAAPFDLICFPALEGLGFRAVQARAAGLAFAGVRLAVRLDGTSAWLRNERQQWPGRPEELVSDYMERYAFENADAQAAPQPAVLAHSRAMGWNVPAGVCTEQPGVDVFARWMARPAPAASVGELPLVSVCVPHYNLGAYLGETLESLALQTYPHLEVLVIDDGSTDPASREVFRQMQARYPAFRFLSQANAGIGATRNRGLHEARGAYFVPLDADNLAQPHMIERLVGAIHHRPAVGAATCYFLAFRSAAQLAQCRYAYACRPTGGPHVLASLRNVYGDAAAIYRTSAFRAVGGYETDRDTSFEDWEAFVKLVHGGWSIDVVPEHLFFYRHRELGFSRITNGHKNRQRVLRQFTHSPEPALAHSDAVLLWQTLAGFHQRLETLEARQNRLRYRLTDAACAAARMVPRTARLLQRGMRMLIGL